MSECLSCEEDKIVSPAKIIANKLCCPNEIQTKNPSPTPLIGHRDHVVNGRSLFHRLYYKWWKNPLLQLRGSSPEDYPIGRLSISDYVEKRDARLIFILRNPDQVIDSMIRRKGKSRERAIARWQQGIREMRKAYAKYEGAIHILSFSNLVTNVDQELKRICDFLQLEYREEMLQGYRGTPQYENSGIDPSMAEKDVPDYKLESQVPEGYEAYAALLSGV